MARKEVISKSEIISAAFDMTRRRGIAELTARKLASFMGCSTQPIFRHFSGMEACMDTVFDNGLKLFDEYADNNKDASKIPFVSLGMAYISYAKDETHLFSFIFMTPNYHGMDLNTLVNKRNGYIEAEKAKALEAGLKNPDDIFNKMFMMIHGAACMSVTGDFDLSDEDTKKLLEDAYKALTKK